MPENMKSPAETKFEKVADSFGRVLAAIRSAFPAPFLGEVTAEEEALQSIAHARGQMTALRDVLGSRLAMSPLPASRNGWVGSQAPHIVDTDTTCTAASKLGQALSITTAQQKVLDTFAHRCQGVLAGEDPLSFTPKTETVEHFACRELAKLGILCRAGGQREGLRYCLTRAGALLMNMPLAVAHLPETEVRP